MFFLYFTTDLQISKPNQTDGFQNQNRTELEKSILHIPSIEPG